MALAAAPAAVAGGAAVLAAAIALQRSLTTGSRQYKADEGGNSVANEYDAWTREKILEYYWGEHIHLGYYNAQERRRGMLSAFRKDFKGAKYDFIDEMMAWGNLPGFTGAPPKPGAAAPTTMKVLDVGCGIGGTSRYLAKKLGSNAEVTGITISPAQVQRATELATEQGVRNAKFELMDALAMTYPDNSFDVVWACESGEHMPDKEKYIQEMARVLKPGGRMIMCTWCQRDDTGKPFTKSEQKVLDFLYSEWTHPYFISINKYKDIMEETGTLDGVSTADWNDETRPSWRHSVWVGIADPWFWVLKPRLWWKCIRDAWTLERMHRAFKRQLMQYGMFRATKLYPLDETISEAKLEVVGGSA
eukprot:scaffold7349_cov383-Pinguiococcus_pyrenoidosus.AAC.3